LKTANLFVNTNIFESIKFIKEMNEAEPNATNNESNKLAEQKPELL
jgi:hypothetical protein